MKAAMSKRSGLQDGRQQKNKMTDFIWGGALFCNVGHTVHNNMLGRTSSKGDVKPPILYLYIYLF